MHRKIKSRVITTVSRIFPAYTYSVKSKQKSVNGKKAPKNSGELNNIFY